MKNLLQKVVDQAAEELGTDKSMDAVEKYINEMMNFELVGLIERAMEYQIDN